MGMVKPRSVLSSDPTLLELLTTFGASGWGKKFELSHSDGNSSFKIGSDDNWGMTQAPQLIRTKISRTKRDNSEGQSGHWKSRLQTRSLIYSTNIE